MKIIGISGGSGSGKTYFSLKLLKRFEKKIGIIKLDSYYKDLSNMNLIDRKENNFDHPDSFDFNLLLSDLNKLEKFERVKIPIYDYKNHIRTNETFLIDKKKIIIVEGIFALHEKSIREKMNLKVYINSIEEIRLKRRIQRDMNLRARSKESILKQYKKTVKPMHEKFVSTEKKYADLIIKNNDSNTDSFNILLNKINSLLESDE